MAKVIKYFFSNDSFKLSGKGNLYLPLEHSFFYNVKNNKANEGEGVIYFSNLDATNNSNSHKENDDSVLTAYMHEEIIEKCKMEIKEYEGGYEIVNSKGGETESIVISSSYEPPYSPLEGDVSPDIGGPINVKIPVLSIPLISVEHNIKLTMTVDAYGFYFFDFFKSIGGNVGFNGMDAADLIVDIFGGDHICHSLNKNHKYDSHEICSLLEKEKRVRHYYGILTHDQLLFLQEGIANYNLNYKLFFEVIDTSSGVQKLLSVLDEYSIGNLIRRILMPFQKDNLGKKINEAVLAREYYEINQEDGVAVRIYDFDYIRSILESEEGEGFKKQLHKVINGQCEVIPNRIENYNYQHVNQLKERLCHDGGAKPIKSIDNMLLAVVIQDIIEEKALTRFIEVTLEYPYLSEIENGVYVSRKRLTNTMLEMTPGHAIDQISFDTDATVYLFTEESLGNYIKLIISKIPLLLTIDSIMRDAFYVKIGNVSSINYTSEKEQIDRLSPYRSWSACINTIISNKETLLDNLTSYYEMKSNITLDETRRLMMSSNDKDDIKYAWDHENSNKAFVISLFTAVSFLYYFTSLSGGGHADASIGSMFSEIMDMHAWGVMVFWGGVAAIMYILLNKALSSSFHEKIRKWFFDSFTAKKSIEYRVSGVAINKIEFSRNEGGGSSSSDESQINLKNSISIALKVSDSFREALFDEGVGSRGGKVLTYNLENQSIAVINAKTQRLHMQLDIPDFFGYDGDGEAVQLFVLVTLVIKHTKINRVEIFLDSVKIHYRTHCYPPVSVRGVKKAVRNLCYKVKQGAGADLGCGVNVELGDCIYMWLEKGLCSFNSKEILVNKIESYQCPQK